MAVPILLSSKLSSLFNRTLALLAVFDNAFIVCDVLESVRQSHGPLGYAHTLLFPHVLYPLQNIALTASIYTTVVVALERLVAVSR